VILPEFSGAAYLLKFAFSPNELAYQVPLTHEVSGKFIP